MTTTTLDDEMAKLASTAERMVTGLFQLDPSKPLAALDRIAKAWRSERRPFASGDSMLLAFGAWLGEHLRRRHGGRWVEREDGAVYLAGCGAPDIAIFPFARVAAVSNGEKPSMRRLDAMLAKAARSGRVGDLAKLRRDADADANRVLRRVRDKEASQTQARASGEAEQRARGIFPTPSISPGSGAPQRMDVDVDLGDGRFIGTLRLDAVGAATGDADQHETARLRIQLAGAGVSRELEVWPYDLWVREGERVRDAELDAQGRLADAELVHGTPVFESMLDTREHTSYLVHPDDTRRTIQVKYLEVRFQIVPEPDAALIRCCHVDAEGYRTIEYRRPWAELLAGTT